MAKDLKDIKQRALDIVAAAPDCTHDYEIIGDLEGLPLTGKRVTDAIIVGTIAANMAMKEKGIL